jgi:hypothetical protein
MNSTPKTAYILQIHKNPYQVNLFINQLISDRLADVYVHIDKRNYEKVADKIIKSPNVKVLKDCLGCEWGDISQVDTTILLLREVLDQNIDYDFVCLRSGQDLLVRGGFKEFLTKNRNRIYMDFFDISWKNKGAMKLNWPKFTRKRYTSAHPLRIVRRAIKLFYDKGISLFPNKKYWPEEYDFYCGSQWFTIPFEVTKYMINFLDENPWYRDYFTHTYTPDEWFFHTLIMNSPYREAVERNNLLYLRMGKKLSERNSPVFLTSEDIGLIQESKQYFARKFDESIDATVIEYFAQRVKFGDVRSDDLIGISN